MTTRLCEATLSQITSIAVPAYDRRQLAPGIVHFGVGNFHRAHQAVYLDELFSKGEAHDWAVIGAGVRDSDEIMRRKLGDQDWLSTVVAQEAHGSTARITAVMTDYLGPEDRPAIVARLADPAIRIVSLTITEGGYYIDPTRQQFDASHPDMRWDAANLDHSKTVFGLILAGLIRRRQQGVAPFTIMSCDNIQGNGEVTRAVVVGLATLVSDEIADWVRKSVAFPSTMVDRITPATSEREIEMVADLYGIADAAPVFCEDYRQWIIEDDFPAGRPALEKVGVQFVTDVTPFERMKIGILNGGHAALAYPAALLDIHFVHEAMQEPLVADFLRKVEIDEIVPAVGPIEGVDLEHYFAQCAKRFANPKIGDTTRRLAHDGSNRQPKFIVPSAAQLVAAGAPAKGLALASAFWCRYCYGTTDSGLPVEPNDPAWSRLQTQAHLSKSDPLAWLQMRDIYGDLINASGFASDFSVALRTIWARGTAATIEAYLADEL